MKKYSTIEGKKDFRPRDGSWWPAYRFLRSIHTWEVVFDESCRYELKKNKGQWNKGGGYTKYFSKNQNQSVMWAWRYDAERDQIEVALYWNDEEEKWFAKSAGFFNIGQLVSIVIGPSIIWNEEEQTNRAGIYLAANGNIVGIDETQANYLFSTKWFRRIGLWFGGSEAAPKVMTISLKYYKEKQ